MTNDDTARALASTRTRVLGTTRIEEPIGKGGMAEIFRGRQLTLARPVAVKVMLPKIARDREMAQRFRREARTLATLQHENIVAVHDLVEKNGQIFMLLEFVEGLDVGELLSKGAALPLDVSLIIATSVARALEHAHFRRVVHRDIKPSNVMVSRRGEVKLADFGIAKELDEADLTKTGFVVGTPSYLAPELLKGQRADLRVDLYAVGVLLFECLTAQKPFRGKTAQELCGAILGGQRESVRSLASECPRAVEKIVDRCLERDLDKRYARAADLRRDLEAQLNKVVSVNPSAKMVAYLFSHGEARPEDLATVDIGELRLADPTIDLSSADLKVVAPETDERSIEIELEEAALEEEGARSSGARRGRAILLAVLALMLVAGGVMYALAPAETLGALHSALEKARSLTGE